MNEPLTYMSILREIDPRKWNQVSDEELIQALDDAKLVIAADRIKRGEPSGLYSATPEMRIAGGEALMEFYKERRTRGNQPYYKDAAQRVWDAMREAQPKPVVSPQTPIGWYVTGTSRFQDEHDAKNEARRCGGTAEARPLYLHPEESDKKWGYCYFDFLRKLVISKPDGSEIEIKMEEVEKIPLKFQKLIVELLNSCGAKNDRNITDPDSREGR